MSCNYKTAAKTWMETWRKWIENNVMFTPFFSSIEPPEKWTMKLLSTSKTPIKRHRTWSSFVSPFNYATEPHEYWVQTANDTRNVKKEVLNCWERKHGWVSTVKKVYMKKQHRSRATEGNTMERTTQTHSSALDIHQVVVNDNFKFAILSRKNNLCDANPSVIISSESSREIKLRIQLN